MADKEMVRKSHEVAIKFNLVSSLFLKFTQAINFPMPFLPPAKNDVVIFETGKKSTFRGGVVAGVSNSATVTNPDGRKKTVAPLKPESEEGEHVTNPIVLWQVCVGFFILKWAWGRWNEHKERKKPSNDDKPSSSFTAGDGNWCL